MHWNILDSDPLDWTWALAAGRRARLLPLWCIMLRRAGRLSTLPADVRQSLKHAFYATLTANTLALEEAVRLSVRMEAQGVAVVALKGVALVATVYPSRGMRPLGDIDLWVQSQDAALAEAVLQAFGYVDLPHQRVRSPQRFLAERTFMRRTPPRLQVDLHTAPFARPVLQNPALTAWLWSHTQRASTEYGDLRIFDATAQFVHLCLHATQHDMGRLAPLRLYDLALVMADPQLDWRAAAELAQATHITPALRQAVAATTMVWGAAPPPGLLWPRTSWRERLRCALTASEQRSLRWLVDGLALRAPASTLALWFALLWPAPAYRRWRTIVKSR